MVVVWLWVEFKGTAAFSRSYYTIDAVFVLKFKCTTNATDCRDQRHHLKAVFLYTLELHGVRGSFSQILRSKPPTGDFA